MIQDRRGTAALETAIILPVFVTLIFAMFDYGSAFWTLASLQAGADSGARCYALQQTCTNAASTASYISGLVGFTVPTAAVTVTASANCGSGITGSLVQISESYSFVVQGLYPGSPMAMSVSGCFPT